MADQREKMKKFEFGPAAAGILVVALLACIALVLYSIWYPAGLGPRQPIPFSHRVHVHYKQVSCLMCHTTVTQSYRAGIPPLQTCMLCHLRIIRTFPYIAELRDHFRRGEPVVWERVNWVPEFVYFNHAMHIRKGIDCGKCHGNVAEMDRIVKAQKFEMGFCIQCHRENNATHDCFVCHR